MEEKQVAHNMDNDLTYRWYGSWKDFGAGESSGLICRVR